MTAVLHLAAGLAVYALLVLVLLRLFRRFGEDQPSEPISHVRIVPGEERHLHGIHAGGPVCFNAEADQACALTQPDADRLRLISGGEGTS